MTAIHKSQRAADLLLDHPEAIMVLERLQIALGVQEQTLEELAEQRGVRAQVLIALLHITMYHQLPPNLNLLRSDIPVLVDYLLYSHEYFRTEAYPEIMNLITKIWGYQQEGSGALMRQFFEGYVQEVQHHFDYEQQVAFPYMAQLASPQGPQKPARAHEGYSVKDYHHQHGSIEDKLNDLKSLLVRFLPPSEPYALVRQLYLAIAALGNDINTHTMIEDLILTPLVAKEEAKWKE